MKNIIFTLFWLLMFLPISFALVEVNPSKVNASWPVFLNFSISNTYTSNISRVEIHIPSGFTQISNIGCSLSGIFKSPSSPNPLIWENDTIGIIINGATEYFWFQLTSPDAPSGTNFTFLINLTYLDSNTQTFEVNITVDDVDPPTYSDISYSKPNNTKYLPEANYGFQVIWRDNVGISTVLLFSNFNSSTNLTVSRFSGHEKEGVYVVNFTDIAAGTYWFIWYANDTSGNWYNTSNITYVIEKADNPISVYLNDVATNYTVLENGTTLNITVLAIGSICVYRNHTELSLIKCENDRWEWNEAMDIGVHQFLVNVSSNNLNYSSNSSGVKFLVNVIHPRIRFKDLQAPSSLTYSPGTTYTFKVTFFSPSYPLNNISNVSFIFNDEIYYLPVNKQDGETYTFTLRDLGVGSYNWKFCANDTQGEINCTSGILTIKQAVPKLDIINVQDYIAPVNKTIIGIGCPQQIICKLYLNNTELSDNFYELNTDKPGYYIFTFNTSGNANYSAASITKSMTIYPPRQTTTTTTTTQPNQTTTTTTQPSPISSQNVLELKANVPYVLKVENSDFLKITEIEITSKEDVENAEIKVEVAFSNEIPKIIVEANKILLTYIKITSNISSEKLDNIKIRFKTEKSWIDSSNIDVSKVALYKFENDEWIKLPTQKVSEDNSNIYYEATLNSFSFFAIVGEVKSGLPWYFLLIPAIVIVGIIVYLFWPTSSLKDYEKLKRKWSSGYIGK